MEEQFNREAKEGCRFAAEAPKITDERANSEDRKHTSGGVFIAIDSNSGTVVGERSSSGSNPRQQRVESPRRGQTCEEVGEIFRCISGTQNVGPPEERSSAGGSVNASQSDQTSLGCGM